VESDTGAIDSTEQSTPLVEFHLGLQQDVCQCCRNAKEMVSELLVYLVGEEKKRTSI
jgi:hypothetical protein